MSTINNEPPILSKEVIDTFKEMLERESFTDRFISNWHDYSCAEGVGKKNGDTMVSKSR